MKKASIIGLGNILEGDSGVGCYILDALSQERLGDSVHLSYLGADPRYAGGLLYDADFAVIVRALSMGGPAGMVHCWDCRTFQQNAAWLVNEFQTIGFLINALGWTVLAGGFSWDFLFLWIDPKVTEGLGISSEAHNALRTAVQIIKKNLFDRGFLSETAAEISQIYRREVLRTVA